MAEDLKVLVADRDQTEKLLHLIHLKFANYLPN